MKMKYLVLGTACLALCASTAWAKPTVKDRSIVGHWKFDDSSDYGKDTSGYGGTSFFFTSGQIDGSASGSGAKWTDITDTGYVKIAKKSSYSAYSASATLGSGNTIASSGYQTMAAWFRADCDSITEAGDQIQKNVIKHINDHGWHFGAMRYHYNASYNSSTYWMITTDPASWSGDATSTTRNEVSSNSKPKFPLNVNGSEVTLGGSIGTSSYNKYYRGDIDEAIVINRMLCKTELTRMYQTGEAYIYSSGTPSFDGISGWSFTIDGTDKKCDTLKTWVPGAIKQTTYLIDGQKTMTYGSGVAAYFGQSADNKVALAVGRAEVLKNRLTGADLINGNNLKGAISITTANTALSFWDLRLNAGSITANANNQSVTADMLDVEGEPFNVSVPANCEFTFNAGGKVTGDGILAKTGDGKLILNDYVKGADRVGFVDAPKVRLAEGSIKTPRLDGYTGGTVLVSTGSTVAFTGDDVLPPEGKKMQIAFDGAKPTAKTAVMTVPNGVTAAMIEDVTAYDGGKVGVVTVENGMVFVEPGFPEDMGAVPVLMVE